jgi:uncharacterized membrane protein (UPF0127 family)
MMKKSIFWRRVFMIAVIFALAAFILRGEGGINLPVGPTQELTVMTADGSRRFDVEVADTPEELQQGLMNREGLADDAGMLFWFGHPPRVVSFWMKDTLIPLDMLFITADGTISGIHQEASPNDLTSISSEEPVIAVLEIAGGRAAALGIKAGDKIDLSHIKAAGAPLPAADTEPSKSGE